MQDKITKTVIDQLMAGKLDDDCVMDTEVRGFQARLLPSGKVRFTYRFYNAAGKRREIKLGLYGEIAVDAARTLVKQHSGAVAGGTDVQEVRQAKRQRLGLTVNAVLDDFEKHHLAGLKSGKQYTESLRLYVRPAIGSLAIGDVTRTHIVKIIDHIAITNNAPSMADRTLAHLRKALNWHALRDEKFNSPIVKGMGRIKASKQARRRILDDREVRDLWQALDELHQEASVPLCFGRFVRTLFLTATRLRMAADMQRDEIDGDVWTVPGSRNKGGLTHVVPLTAQVAKLLESNASPFVFSCDGGKTSFKGFYKAKIALDKKLTEIRKADGRKPMEQWTFHDLRRTARSLMSRAGVPTDHAERVLAHVIGGVRGVYDHYEYQKEKRKALQALAGEVNRILRGSDAKVVAFRKQA